MHRNLMSATCLLFALAVSASAAADREEIAIKAAADVGVSDGSSFQIESFYSAADEAAIRFIDESEQVIAVEGSTAWVSENGTMKPGEDFHKLFALGHQYHALLLCFAELAGETQMVANVVFAGSERSGVSGNYPYGGTMYLVHGENEEQAAGFVFEFPGAPRMEVSFDDWRTFHGLLIPYRLNINDGARTFEYRYTDIEITNRSATWFREQLSAVE